LGSTNGTFVNGKKIERMKLAGGERAQIGPDVVLRFAFTDETEEILARKLYEASTRDPLTQAYTRKFFAERLTSEVAYAERHKDHLSLVMFDLDHFKKTNDEFGHQAGDVVLRSVATQVLHLIRTEDVLARYGGEEFVIVVRGIRHKDVLHFAERIRKSVARLDIRKGATKLEARISMGVASLSECKSPPNPDDLIALADARLYQAKREGRNRVCG
jgi:diguanylate cyclase (GGDEF)-like protein